MNTTAGEWIDRGECPWKGLSAYEPSDQWLFVGRERELRRLQRSIATSSLAGVIGASGSGKSSLIFAGLLGEAAASLSMRPGPKPLETFLELRKAITATHRETIPYFVVDQLEEVFTQCDDEDERRRFLDGLCDIAESGIARVVVALRSDHYGACAPYARFADALSSSHVLLGNLGEEDFRRIVEHPAKACQLRFETDLEQLIIDEVAGEPGALPLLSHALRETWARRVGAELTIDGYESAGGVRGAIARTAETAWLALPAHQQHHVRNILLRLTATGSDLLDISRRVALSELVPLGDGDAHEALESLIRARIVIVDSGTAQIAHEAVFREWPRLRGWLEEDRSALRAVRQVEDNAATWVEAGRDSSTLYRGARLQTIMDLQLNDDRLSTLSHEFLLASREAQDAAAREAEESITRQKRTNRRLRVFLGVALVSFLVAATAGIIAVQKRNDAQAQSRIADARRLAAASGAVRTDQLDLAVLLAVESRRQHDDLDTRGSLFASLTDRPGLRTYLNHAGTVIDATLDPTGRYLANNGLLPSAVEVWDLAGSVPVLVQSIALSDPSFEAYRLKFLPGNRILVGDDAGGVSVADIKTGRLVMKSAVAHDGAVWAVAMSPDGKTAISGGEDGLVRLIDVNTGVAVHEPLEGDGNVIQTTELSPNGKILAVGGDGGELRFYDVATWNLIGEPMEVPNAFSLAWAPDGKQFLLGTDEAIQFYDFATRTQLGPTINAHDGTVYRMSYMAKGSEVATSGEDGRVHFWDAETHLPSRPSLVGHAAGARLALNEAAQLLVTGSDDGRVAVWDLTGAGGVAKAFSTPAGVSALAATPSGTVVAADAGGNIVLFNSKGEPLEPPLHVDENALNAVAISDDATRVASVTSEGTVYVLNPKTGKRVRPVLAVGPKPESVALSADGRWLGTGEARSKCTECFRLYDLNDPSARVLSLRSPGLKPKQVPGGNAIAFNREGTRVVTGVQRGWVDVWELPGGKHLWGAKLERGVRSVAFSPDSSLVAAGANTGLLRLFNGKTGKFVQQLRGHAGVVYGLAFSPDGQSLASTAGDHSLRVWRLDNGLTFGRSVFTGLSKQRTPAWTDNYHVVSPHRTTGAMQYTLDASRMEVLACELTQRNLTVEEWGQYLPGQPYRKTCAGSVESQKPSTSSVAALGRKRIKSGVAVSEKPGSAAVGVAVTGNVGL
jgi:WD40 repeat protein